MESLTTAAQQQHKPLLGTLNLWRKWNSLPEDLSCADTLLLFYHIALNQLSKEIQELCSPFQQRGDFCASSAPEISTK